MLLLRCPEYALGFTRMKEKKERVKIVKEMKMYINVKLKDK